MSKVSIIIATYHRYNLLSRAVKSALAQTHKDIEIIVVDDNPPESKERTETEKVMAKFTDPRAKYIKNQKNSGGAVT